MGQGVTVLVILASEAFDVIFTSKDRAFLGSLGLVSKHVSFQIFEDSSAVWVRASPFLFALFVDFDATGCRALLRPARMSG